MRHTPEGLPSSHWLRGPRGGGWGGQGDRIVCPAPIQLASKSERNYTLTISKYSRHFNNEKLHLSGFVHVDIQVGVTTKILCAIVCEPNSYLMNTIGLV
jgi:hypothetical protein